MGATLCRFVGGDATIDMQLGKDRVPRLTAADHLHERPVVCGGGVRHQTGPAVERAITGGTPPAVLGVV